jgi:hypothetical protein
VSTAGRIVGLTLLCGLALTYLYQHDRSIRLTRQLADLATERQLLRDELDSLNVEVVRLTRFERLDSIWASVQVEPAEQAVVAHAPARAGDSSPGHERTLEFARAR